MVERALTRQECKQARKAAGGAYEGSGGPEIVGTCHDCGAKGYTDGWGAWHFGCGAIVLTDGEPVVECPSSDDE